MDEIAQLDKSIYEGLKALREVLEPDGDYYRAQYMESLILCLTVDLKLNKKQLALLVEDLNKRTANIKRHPTRRS